MDAIITKIDLDNIINEHGLNYQNSEGNSYVHHFARTGNTKLLMYLFSKSGVNINIKNNIGRTALYYSLNENIVELLILHKINYKSKDNEDKLAEEVNGYVNFMINQKCNETKKKLLRNLGII
jgi:ankyrin repeat protein